MISTTPRRRLAGAAVCGAAALGGLVSCSTAVAAAGRVAITGTHPAWAAARTGAPATPADSGPVDVQVYLASRDPAGLAAFARAVSDPKNAAYGDYLTPAEAQSRFAPSPAEGEAVESWLTSAGMSIEKSTTGIAAYVEATGSVAAASTAFGVGFADYVDPEGQTARAPESEATVPSSVAGDVSAIGGLDTAPHDMRPAALEPLPGPNYWIAGPTSSYYGQNLATDEPSVNGVVQPWTVAGYTPQQIRGAYGVTGSGMTGKGQTVAVVDAYASPTMLADANEFSTLTGNQPFSAGQYQQILPAAFDEAGASECDAQGWYGEQTLDVESVHDLAPDAGVRFVAAANCGDAALLAADAYIVEHGTASIVTNSWGDTEDGETIAPVYDLVFEFGAAEGIGFFFSSGDNGYEDPTVEDPGYSDEIQVDFPATSPWVTAVGGTSLAIGPDNNYEWELPWGTLLDPLATDGTSWSLTPPPPYDSDTFDGASGGGVSTVYTQPSYQAGVVPAALATAVPEGSTTTPMRVVPDVSALADPSTGMLVGETAQRADGFGYTFAFSRIGGTSVSSPTFAGIEADAQQAAGHDLGFANPVIYARSGTSAFHDVTQTTPLGPSTNLYEVRNNYTDPSTRTGPLLTYLRAMGDDGAGAAALPATPGYDDSTGVGSPDDYIQSFSGS